MADLRSRQGALPRSPAVAPDQPPQPPGRRGWRGWCDQVLLPVHWSFLLSQLALWSFAVLAVTGVALAVLYRPGAEPVLYTGSAHLYDGSELPRAFASVLRITSDVRGGELLRDLHAAATYLFVASLLGHLLRVLVTGAFRRPRRVNYLLGLVLLLLAVVTAYTGHLLTFDLLAGTSLRISFTLVSSIPIVGEELGILVFGGEDPTSTDVLLRVWAVHLFVLPVLLVLGMALHLALVARQSHARLPQHAALTSVRVAAPLRRSALLGLLVLGILLASSALVPWTRVDLAGPARTAFASNSLQPDWYMFWPEGAMRILPAIQVELGPVVLTNPFVASVLLPSVLVLLLAAYPWLEPLWRRGPAVDHDVLQHPYEDALRLALVTGWGTVLVVLSLGAADDTIAALLRVPVESVVLALRAALVLLPVLVGALAWWYARREGGRWTRSPGPERTR